MTRHTCHDCVYSNWDPVACLRSLESGRLSGLTCVNHPDAPGRIRDVCPGRPCRNFRARRRPPVRVEPPKPPNDDVRYIALTRGKFAIVDKADYEWLNRHRWHTSCFGGKTYARRNTKTSSIMMHRAILCAPKGLVVDHIDGNGLNNRRSNLRVCTQAENCRNAKPRVGTSRFKGVRAHNAPGKFAAEITFEGRAQYIGSFDDEIEAAIAYDLRAVVLFAEFARLNFPTIINATRQAKQQKKRAPRACA